jgi:hypothetical protein
MYAGDRLSHNNLQAFLTDLAALEPALTLRPIRGNVRRDDGTIERTAQIRVAARFRGADQLEDALRLVRRRYLAASGLPSRPGSWHIPDVRITGLRRGPDGTIAAIAHMLPFEGGGVVTLSLTSSPPLTGMRSYPVFLLDRWQHYLQGKQVAGGWRSLPSRLQTETPAVSALTR